MSASALVVSIKSEGHDDSVPITIYVGMHQEELLEAIVKSVQLWLGHGQKFIDFTSERNVYVGNEPLTDVESLHPRLAQLKAENRVLTLRHKQQ